MAEAKEKWSADDKEQGFGRDSLSQEELQSPQSPSSNGVLEGPAERTSDEEKQPSNSGEQRPKVPPPPNGGYVPHISDLSSNDNAIAHTTAGTDGYAQSAAA